MKHQVVYNHFSKWAHTGIILTGCRMLDKRGIIELKFNDQTGKNDFLSPDIPGAELIIDGIPVFFDCADGYNVDSIKNLLKKYNYYFKRSFSEEQNINFGDYKSHIYPLGLNYQVYYRSADAGLFSQTNKGRFYNSLKSIGKQILASKQLVHHFEMNADDIGNRTPQICFMTRLWEYAANEEEKNYINQTRIELVRRIRARYPDNSHCFVYDNSVARKLCPDLIAGKLDSFQPFYLKKMHQSDICIGTMGLFQSTGWKTAEYVAASRAIVCEKMTYEVPGNFNNGKNFLEFLSVEECMKNISILYNDKNLLFQIKKANEEYYNAYAAPDKQVWNALQTVINSLKQSRLPLGQSSY